MIDEENGELLSVHSSSDRPRDRRQLYNIKHKQSNKNRSRNTGPVTTPDFTQLQKWTMENLSRILTFHLDLNKEEFIQTHLP